MAQPKAYFLTWTTYGTWLPGDERNWVDGKDSGPSVPYKAPNARLREAMMDSMAEDPVRLTPVERRLVADSIAESCRIKGWDLHALAVQSNHVHVVLCAAGTSPDRTMAHLKAYATRSLRACGSGHDKHWTRHGSTRWINTDASLAAAVAYVRNQ